MKAEGMLPEIYRAVVESTPDAVIAIDSSAKIVYVNPSVERLFGYEADEILGKPVELIMPPQIHDIHQKAVRRASESGAERLAGRTLELEALGKGGRRIPIELSLSEWVSDGRRYFTAIIRDISLRKEVEEGLARERERTEKYLEVAGVMILALDREGRVSKINRRGAEILKREIHEIVGKDWFSEFIPEEIREDVRNVFERLMRGEVEHLEYYENPVLSADGTKPLIAWHNALLYDEEGNISGTLSSGEDITEKRLYEDALKNSQEELLRKHDELQKLFNEVERAKREWERTMDCMGDMVLIVEGNGVIKRINRAFREFVGEDYAEVIGKKWDDLLESLDVEMGTIYGEGIDLYHRPSGRWFVLKSYPFNESDQGDAGESVIVIHDTTESKCITEKLENTKSLLEAKNRELEEAYNELKQTQSQILQQEKMASIGQLAAGVAHEINNPMGFISSNLTTLSKYVERLGEYLEIQGKVIRGEVGPEELKEAEKRLKIGYIKEDMVDLIKESLEGAERVKKIVRDLKSFSRVDEAEEKMADINECIESTLNIVWNELKYKARVVKEYGDIPMTRCYPQQLNQVFMNLLVNAGHAIEKEGEIRIRTSNGGGKIKVEISDTGCGIPEEIRGRIFEPFFTTKEVGKGTGLGLSITYDIIKKHGGEIEVESEVGKGTTFTITLPVREGN